MVIHDGVPFAWNLSGNAPEGYIECDDEYLARTIIIIQDEGWLSAKHGLTIYECPYTDPLKRRYWFMGRLAFVRENSLQRLLRSVRILQEDTENG